MSFVFKHIFLGYTSPVRVITLIRKYFDPSHGLEEIVLRDSHNWQNDSTIKDANIVLFKVVLSRYFHTS